MSIKTIKSIKFIESMESSESSESTESIEVRKNLLESLLTKNQITLRNLSDLDQNMANLLEIRSTICYQNCENINLKINSKINRLVIDNCKNMTVQLCGVISGIEIKNSCGITIKIKKSFPLSSLVLEKSKYVTISLSKRSYKNAFYDIAKSHGIMIVDHRKKSLYLKN
jgi:hypothetical protein